MHLRVAFVLAAWSIASFGAVSDAQVIRDIAYDSSIGRFGLGAFRFYFDKADVDGWRDGVALVRIPDGANNLYVLLDAGKDEKVRKVEFKDFEIFRIK